VPASSIDTFLACSIMITLVLTAIVTASNNLAPSMNEFRHRNDAERLRQLAQYILLDTGTPVNWGCLPDTFPTSLGLADSASSLPYHIDIDKVTRLNSQNMYSVSYAQLWQSLGVSDVSFGIEIRTLFSLSAILVSATGGGNETIYEFDVYAEKSGAPVISRLHSYVIARDYISSFASSTSSSGHSLVFVTIPNSKSGTALLLTFASAESNPQSVAFNVHAFSHNSSELWPNRTFTKLSPLNHVLNVAFTHPMEEVLSTSVFTFNYSFSLIEKSRNAQTAEYEIPRLLDSSPMLLVITGLNESSSFAEWVSYPQVPLETGADFDTLDADAKTVSFSHIVKINSALYEIVTKWGGSA